MLVWGHSISTRMQVDSTRMAGGGFNMHSTTHMYLFSFFGHFIKTQTQSDSTCILLTHVFRENGLTHKFSVLLKSCYMATVWHYTKWHMYAYAILHNQSVQCVQMIIPSVKECIMQLICWNFWIHAKIILRLILWIICLRKTIAFQNFTIITTDCFVLLWYT